MLLCFKNDTFSYLSIRFKYQVGQNKWPFWYLDNISFNCHSIYLLFFLKDAPSQVLQNGVIFVNVNSFHRFDTCDTIYWSNSHNSFTNFFMRQFYLLNQSCFRLNFVPVDGVDKFVPDRVI